MVCVRDGEKIEGAVEGGVQHDGGYSNRDVDDDDVACSLVHVTRGPAAVTWPQHLTLIGKQRTLSYTKNVELKS